MKKVKRFSNYDMDASGTNGFKYWQQNPNIKIISMVPQKREEIDWIIVYEEEENKKI